MNIKKIIIKKRLLSLSIVITLFFVGVTAAKEEFLTFPQFNFGFKKPSNWDVRSIGSDWCSLELSGGLKDKNFPLFISIKALSYSTNDLNVCADNLIPAVGKSLLGNLVKTNDIKKSDISLAGSAAKEVIYIGEGATQVKNETVRGKDSLLLKIDTVNVPILVKLVFTIKDGIVYMLEYGGREEEFKAHEDEFASIVASFVISKKVGEDADKKMQEIMAIVNRK